VLTVIASESYESFAKGLQSELAEAVAGRPRAVTPELFEGRTINDAAGNTEVITADTAREIWLDLRMQGYIDKVGTLTDKYYADKANGSIKVADEVASSADSIIRILDSVYSENATKPENARKNDVTLTFDEERFKKTEFQALWSKINTKSVYVVDFKSDALIKNAITALDRKLRVSKIYFKVKAGEMESMSGDALRAGEAFIETENRIVEKQHMADVNRSVKYDLVGKLVEETKLTRKDIVAILQGIKPPVFRQFKYNPEDFIIKAAAIINDEKATIIVKHITYDVLDRRYDESIFTEPTIRGKLGVNAMKTARHLYDHVVCDSKNELEFVSDLDRNPSVSVYVKLPSGFFIPTPVGKYNPDWAIAFYEGTVKHIYFVAETKGTNDTLTFNHISPVEQAKIDCARKHFEKISGDDVVYDVVDSYQELMEKVMR